MTKFVLNETENVIKNFDVQPEFYILEGKKYVRVTKAIDIIAKPEFYRWYAKFGYRKCKQIMENRSTFGTRMHKYHEDYLYDKDISEDLEKDTDEMKMSLIKFKDWVAQYIVEVKGLEVRIFSEEHMYGGTGDCLAICKNLCTDGKNQKLFIDWKSGKKLYDNYFLQLAAYVFGYEEMTGERLDGGCLVRFRDGKVEHQCVTRDDLKKEYSVFLSALHIWRWKHG